MIRTLTPKVLIVGGGPGGYVAAIRCGQLGLETILVDADRLGGTCLLRGCIPSKALIHAASLHAEIGRVAERSSFGISLAAGPTLDFAQTMAWKNGIVDRLTRGVAGLLRRSGVTVLSGWARFSDAKTCLVETEGDPVRIKPEHVVLATGSVEAALPALPFSERVISSNGLLSLTALPRSLAIVGAGYIGVELGTAIQKLGTAVTLVEAQSRILPSFDPSLSDPVLKALRRIGVDVRLNAQADGLSDDGLVVRDAGGMTSLCAADKVLVTVGRKPATEGWGLDAMAIERAGAFVRTDDQCRTSTRNVWAIGDLTGEPMLAHRASAQGEMVAELIAGKRRRWDALVVPAVCFTDPEIVSVGLAPGETSGETVSAQFPFSANGRRLTLGAEDDGGFVRVIARKDDHRILGLQAVGAHVAELVHQFTTLIEMGAVLEDVAGVIHAHPTLGEATHEASLMALGHPIHF